MAEKMTHAEACVAAKEYFEKRIMVLNERAYDFELERRDEPADWEYYTEKIEALYSEIRELRNIAESL